MKSLTKFYEDMVLNPEPNEFCMLKPGFTQYEDEFLGILKTNGWKVMKSNTRRFSKDEIENLYSIHKDKPFYNKLCDYMITDDCACYSCYKKCKDPIGDMKVLKKKVREQWGEDDMRNAMHCSDTKDAVRREIKIAFAGQVNEDNNADAVQIEIDNMTPNSNGEINKLTPDGIKSIIANNMIMGKCMTIVSDEKEYFLVKMCQNDFMTGDKISKVVTSIAKFFKCTEGSPKVEIDNKKYYVKIYKK